MLKIHILNVDQGDSILLEHQSDGTSSFAVIDSNRYKGEEPAALKKLKSLNANRINFIALTHPHADHYRGLLDILQHYSSSIDNFYSFPLALSKTNQLKKIAETYQKLINASDSPLAVSSATEYVKLLYELKHNLGIEKWEELVGFENTIPVTGFEDVTFQALLPYASAKGDYYRLIEEGSMDIIANKDLNELSLAIKVIYKGHEIILGGDATYNNWIRHRKDNGRRRRKLNAIATKLPHHGSKKDCRQIVLKYLFSNCDDKYAFISANGKKHPHQTVIKNLEALGILPYCTNLSVNCSRNYEQSEIFDDSLDPNLRLFINRVMAEIPGKKSQPCQGDIIIKIDSNGVLSVQSEYDMACPYRGSYDILGI